MTTYIPTNFKESVKQKLNKIEVFRKLLDDSEIKRIIPKFLKFYEDPKNEKAIFNDGYRDWIILQTPEKNQLSKPKPADSEYTEDNHLWICKFKLGQLSLFATYDQCKEIGWDSTVLITGKLTRKYQLIGQPGYYKSLELLAKAFNMKTEEITEDDYHISYSYNFYQLIERL